VIEKAEVITGIVGSKLKMFIVAYNLFNIHLMIRVAHEKNQNNHLKFKIRKSIFKNSLSELFKLCA